MSDISIITRGRGQVLVYDGYEYYKHTNYEMMLWRCAKYKKTKCGGTLNILPDQTLAKKGKEHIPTCIQDLNKAEITLAINDCVNKVCEVNDTVPAVFSQTVAALKDTGLHLVEGINVPSFSNLKSTLYRRRNKAANVTKMAFRNVSDVEVPDKFKDFMLADYKDENRILIFASEEAREHMASIKTFFGDGTFKSCPEPFVQIYTIHGDLGSNEQNTNIIPLVYALLPNRTFQTYSTMLDLIQSQIPEWNPTQFVTDFEEAAIGAIAGKFPDIVQRGCYYHFCNSLWKKAKKFKINNNNRSRRIVALCCKLPLLPDIVSIKKGREYVKSEQLVVCSSANMANFMTYMEYWMGPNRVTLLCTFGQRHRTTNFLEGWHHKLNTMFKGRPTTIYECLKKLVQDAAFYAVQASSNQTPKKRSKTSIDNDIFIQTVQMQLIMGEIDIPLFLEKLR